MEKKRQGWTVERTTNGVEEIVLLHRPNNVPIVVARGGLAYEVFHSLQELIALVPSEAKKEK